MLHQSSSYLPMNRSIEIISWNVRGLNVAARCLLVNERIAATPCHIACLQETKLSNINTSLALFLGAYKLNAFAYKPSNGTRGGILLLWNENVVDISDVRIGRYSITAEVTNRHDTSTYTLTTVYGPSKRTEKDMFLNHLREIRPPDDSKWVILGDFNLIYRG